MRRVYDSAAAFPAITSNGAEEHGIERTDIASGF